uniref:Uncharacterized protein n=1 Tax=Tetradesmus obliquus TaxID=3088 RepID=A0A383W8N2_TETOB|eukprot:jgi/Sobl393_1/2614/SZX73046.1
MENHHQALRQAVQESSYCGVEVVLRPSAPLSCLRSFVQWLPKHFRLVQSVRYIAEEPAVDEVDGLPWQQHLEEGGLLLQEALQSAAAAAAAADAASAAAAAAAAAAAGTEVKQQQPGLRLANFSSSWRGAPELLAALPAHSLTQLHLDLGWPKGQRAADGYSVDGEVTSAALAGLSSLQQLTLANTDGMCGDPASWLSATSGMPPLTLRTLRLPCIDGGYWPALDFCHLTQLQELVNGPWAEFHPETRFPPQLRQLDVGQLSSASVQEPAMAQLQQLQGLTCVCWSKEKLQRIVAQLPALQQLPVQFDDLEVAAAAAPIWAQLPQLCELKLHYNDTPISREDWEAIQRGLAAATSLTKLDLLAVIRSRREAAVEACSALAGLTRLRDLCFLPGSRLVRDVALALTALNGFTRLVLAGLGAGVGDEAAAALARSCHGSCWPAAAAPRPKQLQPARRRVAG